MKQFTKIAVVCALAVSLAACGKKDPATSNPGSGSGSTSVCCLFRGCFQRCCFF